MKVFEFGILKDGHHRLAYVPGNIIDDSEVGPSFTDPFDQYDGGHVLGEVHILTASELKQRDWLYSAFKREVRKTSLGEKVQVYVLGRKPKGFLVDRGCWLYPRQNCPVYRLEAVGGGRFEGSYREILEKLYLDQWTIKGRQRFKAEVARRIKMLGGREVRTETVEAFFTDLKRSRAVTITRLWPRKIILSGN